MDEELEKYIEVIRKFPTYKMINYLFQESLDIYNNHEGGFKFEYAPVYNTITKEKVKDYRFDIGQWDLVEFCFNFIKYGTDYRNSTIERTDFYTIYDKTRHISELFEDAESMSRVELEKHLMCISNMQFDFEQMNIRNRFNRLYYIMKIINKNDKYAQTADVCYMDFDQEFYKIIGIDYEKYIRCFLFIILLSITKKNNNLMDLIDGIVIDESKTGFNTEDLKNIVLNQAQEYTFYKKSNNWNILKYNPIVRCERFRNDYLITNVSAILITFSEYMYWAIRNNYRDKETHDRYFTSYFGHCFEFYLDDFLTFYGIKHKKIKEDDEQKPDWEIETTKYCFLIEQKTTLYTINTRTITIENRIEMLNNFLKNTIEKAFFQLNNYDAETNKITIRICLTFEQVYVTETIQELTIPNVKNIKADYLNWIVPIDDFEKLFIILSEDEEEFNKIIEKKIDLEKTKYDNGRGFDTLLSSYTNTFNMEYINFFDKLLNEQLAT